MLLLYYKVPIKVLLDVPLLHLDVPLLLLDAPLLLLDVPLLLLDVPLLLLDGLNKALIKTFKGFSTSV